MRVFMLLVVLCAAISTMASASERTSKMRDTGHLKLWVADPLKKILPDSPALKPGGSVLRIECCRNEYESGQIVVTPPKRVEQLTVTVSPVTGPSGVIPRLEAHFLGFIPVEKGSSDTPEDELECKTPARIPDPLLDTKSVSVEAGENQPIWITVYTPASAKPGKYTGTVEINADGERASVPMEVRIHDVKVPEERTLFLTNWFNTRNIAKSHGVKEWGKGFWKMLESYAWCMADHRQNVVRTPTLALVTGQDDGSGKLSFDFTRFDRWVELFQRAEVIGYIEGGHLGGRSDWEATDFNAHLMTITNPDGSIKRQPVVTVTSEEYREFLSQFIPALRAHLEEKGWLGIYFQHLADEPIPVNAESYNKLSSYVREFGPKIKIIDASMCTEIARSLDIWVPQPPEIEQKMDFFRGRQAAGDRVWFYTCLSPRGKYMNRFLDYPLLKTRLLHWMNFKYDLTGYLHWGFNSWRGDPFTDLQSDWLPPGDSHIVYPGKRGPMSSIRLSALRDGVEDFELLKMLEKKDAKKAREISDSVVRSMTDYTLDPAEFRAARLRLLKALE